MLCSYVLKICKKMGEKFSSKWNVVTKILPVTSQVDYFLYAPCISVLCSNYMYFIFASSAAQQYSNYDKTYTKGHKQ